MTRCKRVDVNLKSTAYNQNGQNYFEQLTAYNSMSSHLRRILLAKCVVDAKNKNHTPRRRKQACKDNDHIPECVKTEIPNNVIDELAYDSLHHPADFLRMSYNTRYLCQRGGQQYFTDCYNYDVICSRSRLHNHVICPDSRLQRQFFTQSNYNKTFKPVNLLKSAVKIQDISEHRFGDDSIVYKSASDFITREVDRLSPSGNSSRRYENSENARQFATMSSNQRRYKKEDEIKYAKFVYEITREIMHRGLYTDRELQEVFKKHLAQNMTVLEKNKMLYEIYQLKRVLNVPEDDDSDEEELEDVIRTQQLLNIAELRPPTPPKILNENKLMEKLRSFEEKDEEVRRGSKDEEQSHTTRRKSVVLVDANPQLVVTERDVLTSLIEADINPEHAQKICKQLYIKSKESLSLRQARAGPSNERHTVRENDLSNSDLNQLSNEHQVDEQEKSCTTSDLIKQENKNTQAE